MCVSFLFAARDGVVCSVALHERRRGCVVLVPFSGGLRESIQDIGPLKILRASTCDGAKSLRALDIVESVD